MDKKRENIIFVGSVVNKDVLCQFPDASVAGNKMQMGFINGFNDNRVNVSVVSVEPHGMWKCNNKPVLIKSKAERINNIDFYYVGYINIPILKQVSVYFNIFKKLKSIYFDKNTTLITYNTMSIFALPVLKIAKLKHCKCIAIIADLPIIMKKNIIRRLEDKNQEKLINKFDALIPLTSKIVSDFAPSLSYCLVEAGFNPKDYKDIHPLIKNESSKDKNKHIVFSGTLNEMSGIQLILSAMNYLCDKNIVLDIYGDGKYKDLVLESVKRNKNICYHGKINNEQMIRVQANADLLVCPRLSDEYTTKYTFPSKVLEYLCVGVPIISNRLDGIPIEYDEYLHYPNSENAYDWAHEIIKILDDYDYYKSKSIEAFDKLLINKTWKVQCERVLNFLKELQR